MEVGVLFQRNGFLALNKPPGICSQGPKTSLEPELWEMVRMRYPGGGIAHRIDLFTSGVNLAGESRKQVGYLMCNWHQITKKVYLAIVRNPKKWNEQIVSTPISGKTAVTAFSVLERNDEFALVQCELVQNGRTHQIRKHLRSIVSPIVGDCKYHGAPTTARRGQLLHAWRMYVRLPNEAGDPGEWTKIQALIPDDFKRFSFRWPVWDLCATPQVGCWPVPANWRSH